VAGGWEPSGPDRAIAISLISVVLPSAIKPLQAGNIGKSCIDH
jgi:hypothetical protein